MGRNFERKARVSRLQILQGPVGGVVHSHSSHWDEEEGRKPVEGKKIPKKGEIGDWPSKNKEISGLSLGVARAN